MHRIFDCFPVDGDRSVSSALPPGLLVLEDFVSPEEELQLLHAVDWTPCTDDVTGERYLGCFSILKLMLHRLFAP